MPSGKILKASSPYKTSKVLGFNLSTPAIIALFAYIILALTILLPFEFPVHDDATGEDYVVSYDIGQRLVVILLLTIPIVLSIYSINCFMMGKCMVWSYVVTTISVFWVITFVITALLYTFKGNKENFRAAGVHAGVHAVAKTQQVQKKSKPYKK